jgi:2-methylcitrate dehydratase PrpD
MAAMLAKEGYTANALSVFEHGQGFFEVFNGAGFYAPEKARTHWARPWDIVEPGIAIKQYPCCGSTHPAVDCAIELFQEHRFAPQDIERIHIWIHARRLTHTNRPHPQSELDAKFSVQYVVVRALLEGRVGIGHFEPKDFQSSEVLALLPKVQAQAYDDTMFEASNHFAARVSVTLKGGQVFTTEVLQPHGRTSKNPLTKEQLKAKFDLCAQKVLTPKGVELAYQWIESILTQSDAGSLEKIFAAHLK